MTKSINYQNQSIPAYSGITINITNPTLNAAPLSVDSSNNYPMQPSFTVDKNTNQPQNYTSSPMSNPNILSAQNEIQGQNITPKTESPINPQQVQQNKSIEQEKIQNSYPPQYYLNNYNYIQNGEKAIPVNKTITPDMNNQGKVVPNYATPISHQEEDMSSSQEIIGELDSRVAEQKELEKNGKKTKVVALTNEYIMSLENYLNNPNTEIRLMAAKEILTRLDEDKERHNDAALNALLNKMLQDPEKLVRIAALSAFSSQLASGNDFTVKLLKDIQNNPNSDKEDVLQAADGLLKMSTSTEIKYTVQTTSPQKEQQVEQQ